MMLSDFVILAALHERAQARLERVEARILLSAKSVIYRTPDLSIHASGHVQTMLHPSLVCIIGRIFDQFGVAVDLARTHAPIGVEIAYTGGRAAIERCWGAYVAIVIEPDGASIVRDPSGAMPCYYAQKDGLLIIASSIDPILASGLVSNRPDWAGIGQHLLAKDLRLSRTCLEGVLELPRGWRCTIRGNEIAFGQLWNPWSFVRQRDDRTDAERAEALRTTVALCVKAQAQHYRHVLLGVSGGLDSSIVAACLCEAGASLTCVTLATEDKVGDERDYARELCSHLGIDLIQAAEDVDLVDVLQSHSAHLPRPIARSFAQSGNVIQEQLAERVGADAFFNGAGGDNVFCLLTSARPIADQIRTEGLGRRTLQASIELARLSGTTLLEALWKGAARAWRRQAGWEWPLDRSLLAHGKVAPIPLIERHSWLAPTAEGLPGQAAHIALLLGIENHLEGFRRELKRPMVSPLMSQPVVELCLSYPTWRWNRGGWNRATARDAFCRSLPDTIAWRHGKGTPGPLMFDILNRNLEVIREGLLDGLLSRSDLLDRHAIEAALRESPIFSQRAASRVLQLMDVEAWLRGYA